MDLTFTATAQAVAGSDVVTPVGGRTQWETGGDVPADAEVAVAAGIVRHDPADLTVTVAAGTRVADLTECLAEQGQECPLDPRSDSSTVGGVIAVGLSGHRRLGYGPVRDHVLQVRVVLADGRVVKGGGPTVKNVSGYDLPRLFTGSMGTLGVIVEVILRCRPRAPRRAWFVSEHEPGALRDALHRPISLLWDGEKTRCLLEGDASDVEAESRRAGLGPAPGPPEWPDGPYRGRASVAPGTVRDVVLGFDGIGGLRWLADPMVGTVHVATDEATGLHAARVVAARAGGWLLREVGPGVDGFGCRLPNAGVMERVKAALDPTGKMNPGRMPL